MSFETLLEISGAERLTKRDEQNTQTERNTATSKMAPKMMKSCSNFAKESSQITTISSEVSLQQTKNTFPFCIDSTSQP